MLWFLNSILCTVIHEHTNALISPYLHGYVLYKCTLDLRAHLIASLQLVSDRGTYTTS